MMMKKFRRKRKQGQVIANLEYGYSIFSLLVLTSALDFIFYQVLGSRSDNFGEVNGTRLVVSTLVYLIAIVLSIPKIKEIQGVISRSLFLLPVFFIPMVSMAWSVDPGITFFRSSAYLLTCAFSLFLVVTLSPEEFFRRLMIATFIGAILCFFWVAVSPGDAIHSGGPLTGAWKGVYGHKNDLGRIGSIAIIVSIFVTPLNKWQNYIRWANIALFLILVILSDSKTNWLILLSMIGFIPLTKWLRNPGVSPSLRIMIVGTLAATLTVAVLTMSEFILALMGRDDSFSGRGTLWNGVKAIIEAKFPLLGAGYGAFFTDAGGVWELKGYLRYWHSLPNHAHNGYLNTQADMGYPGLIVLVIFLFLLAQRTLAKMIYEPHRPVWAGYAGLLFLFLVNNFSESNAFVHSDIAWMMILVSYGHVASTQSWFARTGKRTKFKFKSWGLAQGAR